MFRRLKLFIAVFVSFARLALQLRNLYAPLFQYSLTVKNDEAKRLESEVRAEEQALQRKESELRLAEQAFDQFLQENDRKAIAAMKRFGFLSKIPKIDAVQKSGALGLG